MVTQFKYLFTPLKIGPVTVRNRFLLPAHDVPLGSEPMVALGPGLRGERYAYYLAERAKGGVGLIIFGQQAVHPSTTYEHPGVSIGYDERALPAYKLATQMVHEHGAKVFLQLFHSGQFNPGIHNSILYPKAPPWAPSPDPGWLMPPFQAAKGIEIEEIKELVQYYGRCAALAKEGGFDGIEIHSTHGYLLEEFLSPHFNRRTDQYGGSLENRMRLHLEIVDSVRAAVGYDMAVGLRLPGDQFVEGGLTPDDMREVCKRLEATGKVNYVSISVSRGHGPWVQPTMYDPPGPYVPLAANIKEVVSIAVFTVGRINDPLLAEKIVAEGQADMVGMVRGHIAEPHMAMKAQEGRLEDIRACIYCLENCTSCTQNPEDLKEKEWGLGTLKKATHRKRVLVVGGGPAGMEAARMASLRGHDVMLYERDRELGGQIRLAKLMPGRGDIEELARWRRLQIEKQGVKIVLGTEVTPELVADLKPDAVVVATGSYPLRNGWEGYTNTPIKGWQHGHVTAVEDILEGKVEPGQRVVIYDTDTHIRAPGIAEYLADRGRQVEILTPYFVLGQTLPLYTMPAANVRVARKGVKVSVSTRLREITEHSVVAVNVLTGEKRTIDGVDTVILVTGNMPNESLYFALKGKVKELYRVGDCVAAGRANRAIHEGYYVGRML